MTSVSRNLISKAGVMKGSYHLSCQLHQILI